MILRNVKLFKLIFNCKKNISELSCVVTLIIAQLVIAEVEYLEVLKVSEVVLESFNPRHTKPVAGEVEMLKCLKVEHVLEIETVLLFNAVIGQTELLKFRSLDCGDQVTEIVDDTHADQFE